MIDPGDMLLTKVANGICSVVVMEVTDGRVHYSWVDGARGSVPLGEIGWLNDTEQDFQYVRPRSKP